MHYQCHITKNRVNIKAYQQKLVTDLCSRLARHFAGGPARHQYGGFTRRQS